MFFGYPIAATQNNWFHDCLCEALRTIHKLVDNKRKYPAWPGVLPTNHQSKLGRRPKLGSLLKAYYVAAKKLSSAERTFVLKALEDENRIPELLSGAADCSRKDELPNGIREAIVGLFEFAFDILGPNALDIRRQHYLAIYQSLPKAICPFCGISYFTYPGGPQEDLDHYLAKALYPFAAANLRNLVPTCHDCNSKYKFEADMVRRADGTGRVAFDPYNCTTTVTVTLDGSMPFVSGLDDAQAWKIQLTPQTPEVKTWDEVFSICTRYRRDHLKPWYKTWVEKFVRFARAKMSAYSDQRLIDMLREHEENLADEGYGDRAFLKAAVFRMLRLHCEAGCREALDHLKDWIFPPTQ